MASGSLSGFVKFLTMIPHLFVLGASKFLAEPAKQLAKLAKELTRIPEFIFVASRAAFRKFF